MCPFEFLSRRIETKQLHHDDIKSTIYKILSLLSSRNPIKRDDGAYSSLSKLLFTKECEQKTRKYIYNKLTSNLEQFIASSKEQMLVETLESSFSILLLASLVNSDNNLGKELNLDELDFIRVLSIKAFLKNKILTGFDNTVGWVHLPAHFGDLMTALVIHPNSDNSKTKDIVSSIYKRVKLVNDEVIFKHDEHHRLAGPIAASIMVKHISQEELPFEKIKNISNSSSDGIIHQNLRNLYRSIELLLVQWGNKDDEILSSIRALI